MTRKRKKNDIIDKGKYIAQEISSDSKKEPKLRSFTKQSNPFLIKPIKVEFYEFSIENLQGLASHKLLSFPNKSWAHTAQETSDDYQEYYDQNFLSEFESTNSSKHFAISHPKSIAIFQPQPQAKTYNYEHKQNATIKVLQIEKEFWDCDPNNIALKIFPPGFHFRPTQLNKTHAFYRFILVDTNSVRIKHYLDKNNPNNIFNSTFQILKVLNFSDLGQNPNQLKNFSQNFDPVGYNYWDYIDAWYCTFWYQNKYFNHSWYIYFIKENQYQFPQWFKQWWDFFGPCEEILAESIQHGLKTFSECFNQEEEDYCFPIDLHYFSKLSLGWISSWDYKYEENNVNNPNMLPILQRVMKTKWWGKFHQSWGDHDAVQKWLIDHQKIIETSDKENKFVNKELSYMGDPAILPSTSNIGYHSFINNQSQNEVEASK